MTRLARKAAAERARLARIASGEHVPTERWPVALRIARHSAPGAGGCIVWLGSRSPKGYGRLNIAGRVVLAHRAAYELAQGSIPPGLTVDHLCRNPPCVNPDHMEIVTAIENFRRGPGTSRLQPCGRGHDPSRKVFRRSSGRMVYCRDCRNDQRRAAYAAERAGAG